MLAIPAPAQQPARWRLVEEWRVGGAVDGPHSLGDVRGLGVLPDGHIVVLDYKDQQLHFLDAKGQPLRTVGRKGSGPGEYRQANGLAISPRGEVIVNDPSNNRLTLLAPNGDLLKTIAITNPWGFQYIWDARYNPSGLLDEFVPVRKPGATVSTPARRVWSADFSSIDTIFAPDCPNAPHREPANFSYEFRAARGGARISIPFVSPRVARARTADGATWSGEYPDFTTVARTPPGQCDPDVTIELRGPRVRVPAEGRDSAIAAVRKTASLYGAPDPDFDRIPREFPAYDALFLDPSRRLWVERRVNVKTRRFDVFGPSGALVAEVEVPVAFRGGRPVIITSDRALGFIADEDDVLYLASFRIVRGSVFGTGDKGERQEWIS
jgi:hypothetical protein